MAASDDKVCATIQHGGEPHIYLTPHFFFLLYRETGHTVDRPPLMAAGPVKSRAHGLETPLFSFQNNIESKYDSQFFGMRRILRIKYMYSIIHAYTHVRKKLAAP